MDDARNAGAKFAIYQFNLSFKNEELCNYYNFRKEK